MQLALFNLPVEILDQIFHEAISVRTCPRALRLRLVCRAFEHYISRVLLQGHKIDEVFNTLSICHYSMRALNGISSRHRGKPSWIPLITKYVSRRIYRATDATSQGWRDAYLLDLAQRLYEMRSRSGEERSSAEDGMLRCLEHVVGLDLYKGKWRKRDSLMDQLDDGSWKTDGVTSDLLDVAVWLDDMDLIRQLLPVEEAEICDHHRRSKRLSIRLVMAGERGNFRTLQFLRYRDRELGTKLPSKTIRSLLVRGYQSANPDLFHFALEKCDEAEPISAEELGYIALYCPSPHAYCRIIGMLEKSDPFSYFHERSPIGCDLSGGFRLSMAARQGYIELVKYFVNGVVPFDKIDRERGLENETDELERYQFLGQGLLGAIRGGSLPVVEYLLDSGASPHTCLCLNAAIRRGYREITELLVWYGADVTRGIPPPISIAVVQEDMDLFRYLLEKGALSGGSGWFGGAWAMSFAKSFGLDSMVAELVRAGVSEDLRMHWVQTWEESWKRY